MYECSGLVWRISDVTSAFHPLDIRFRFSRSPSFLLMWANTSSAYALVPRLLLGLRCIT